MHDDLGRFKRHDCKGNDDDDEVMRPRYETTSKDAGADGESWRGVSEVSERE